MAFWVIRTGRFNEFEEKFLDDNRIYLTWNHLQIDLSKFPSQKQLKEELHDRWPDAPIGKVQNHAGQIWTFAHKIGIGDWVASPKKHSGIHIAEVTGNYTYDPTAENPFYHYRTVKWLKTDIPRTHFNQDILYSFGGISTIFQVQKNDAENRVRNMLKNDKKPPIEIDPNPNDIEDLEETAMDQIVRVIYAKFKGHALEKFVESILQAQGYVTYHSPKGSDGGTDILASAGGFGFDHPKICVQVKSQDSPLESQVLDQLLGTMHKVGADYGLLVSWGGFKKTILDATRQHFFKVRFWDQTTLIKQFLACYDKLDEDIKSMIPLKKIWVMTSTEDEEEQ
ncbi:MAG: restriction endonuclease [Planctomycetaceae bacterium]|nr:restriction endonuclease [Planctomycetaceae bacterium]